jgi:hypothetical protein
VSEPIRTAYWLYRWPMRGMQFSDKPIRFNAADDAAAKQHAAELPPCFKWELYDRSGWHNDARLIGSYCAATPPTPEATDAH